VQKLIALFDTGKVKKFEMNDRCAAGTGKFLETMARTLGFDIDAFGREALAGERQWRAASPATGRQVSAESPEM
jgi:activator of 2-hydroxyglutaryl-CoA dehydratase